MIALALLVLPLGLAGVASAQAAPLSTAPAELESVGPGLGAAIAAAPMLTAQVVSSSRERWFDRRWAAAELVSGLLGAGYAAYVLDERSSQAEAVGADNAFGVELASIGLAINLRLVSHAALSAALFDGGPDARAYWWVPSVGVTTVPGGGYATFTWAS